MTARDDDPGDALYAVAPERFVTERDTLAKALRAEGDRAGADRVRALRKPTRAAWAVNVAVREHPEAARELADAARRLQDTQQDVLAGGDVSLLRDAEARARAAVDALAATAPATDGPTADKVRATLRAATVDADVLAEVTAGRLAREQMASGFGGLAAALAGEAARAEPTRANASGAKPAREKTSGAKAARAAQERRAAEEQRRRAAQEEQRQRAEQEQRRRADERAARAAARAEERRRERLRRAQEAEASAQEAVSAARRALEQVEATLAERRADVRAAEAELSDARRRREQAEG